MAGPFGGLRKSRGQWLAELAAGLVLVALFAVWRWLAG